MNPPLRGAIAVFAGPSLPPMTRPDHPRLIWLPPAVAGDGYALRSERLDAVVLIDGLFDAWPAIRHKELLTLMADGVLLLGAASMGALRAAELHVHGMIGVGSIFNAFAANRLTGDDEVAVIHGPADMGWAALTEAMVNVRATTLAAVRAGVIDVAFARLLLRAGRETFYAERTWAGLIETMQGLGPRLAAQIRRFEDWLPGGRVNLKQRDARAAVEAALGLDLNAARPVGVAPPSTPFTDRLADRTPAGLAALEGRGRRY